VDAPVTLTVFFPVLLTTWGRPSPADAASVAQALIEMSAQAADQGIPHIYVVDDCIPMIGLPDKHTREAMAAGMDDLGTQYPNVHRAAYLITHNHGLRAIIHIVRKLSRKKLNLTPCATHVIALDLLTTRMNADNVPFPAGLADELLERHANI
jgi:hypothetical protein